MTSKTIKYLSLYFILSLLAWPTFAMQNRLLECLGHEELLIHQGKTTGPIYYLNQEFINSVSSISDIDIKDSYYATVCHNKVFTPSVALLKTLLLHGEDVFDYSNLDLTIPTDAFKKTTAQSLLKQVPHIWFSYLASLLTFSEAPDCFNKEIPEVSYFQERYKYLEEDYRVEQLMNDDKKIKSIFEKLTHLESIVKKCRRYVVDPKERILKQKSNLESK